MSSEALDKTVITDNILKYTLKEFDDFKNKQQKFMTQFLFISKSTYILKVYLTHDTLR